MAMEHVVNINVRISQKLADEMDALVNEGRHSTRADVLRTALIVYLNSTSILADKVGEMDLGVGENLRGIKERFLALAWQEGVTSWIQGEEGNHNILVVDTLAFNLAGLKYLLVIFIPFGRRQLTVF